MTETKPTRIVRRGRLFPEIQWTEAQKAQWREENAATYQRCKVVFDRVQPELMKTHYNWYLAVEPESGDYFIDQDELVVAKMVHQKHPNSKPHVFRINETGVSGTI
ncbi:MAG: hypothetical protein U7123_15650 [Potamolinea sp.]